MRLAVFAVCAFLAALITATGSGLGCLAASEYHVDPRGNDDNDGRRAAPLRTIAAASLRLVAGDTCIIHAGSYRETIRPIHSGSSVLPIIYQAAPGALVLISATTPITGWTAYKDGIYQAAMAWDLGKDSNQILIDGQMMMEARWPQPLRHGKSGSSWLAPTLASATVTAGSNEIRVPDAGQPTDYWAGANLWGEIGNRWTAQTAQVSSSKPGSITVTAKSAPWYPDTASVFGKEGGVYLSGTLNCLTAPGEWLYQQGTVYLMPPDGKLPTDYQVEARSGRLIADLKDCQWVVVRGVHGLAGTISMLGSHCTVEDCVLRYVSQEPPRGYASHGGIDIQGTGNVLRRCLIDTSSANGIALNGTGNLVSACDVRDIDYSGDYSAAVAMGGSMNILEHCTLSHSGRALVVPDGQQSTIRYNDLSFAMELTQDGGAIYAWRILSHGSEICYNSIHDCQAAPGAPAPYVGIYLDDGCCDFLVHHNLIRDCSEGIRLNHKFPTSGHRIYQNTWWADKHGMALYGHGAFTDIRVWNNLSNHDDFVGTDVQHNLVVGVDAFASVPTHDFTLAVGSPGADAGGLIPGFTPSDTRLPVAAGAYPAGIPAWVCGVPAGLPHSSSSP